MALDDNPWVFRYEGKLWVSETGRERAVSELRAQREWDALNAKLQRWWVAIAIGAVVGVVLTLALGTATAVPPVIYLFALPIGFGVGAVLGALVNKRITPESAHVSLPERPTTPFLVRVPPRVAAKAPADASARDLIEWSQRGYVS
ncbi:MAG: hypothetical protein KF761_10605 [Salinibacterium sp.]|nr:hypothetical protein [Salinibacterium sp.]